MVRLPNLRSAVIPNGVDVPSTLNRTEAHGRLRLLYIGRLDPKKGIEGLLKACSMMPGNNWQLAIAGWGAPSYVAHLRQQINDLGLNHQVEWTMIRRLWRTPCSKFQRCPCRRWDSGDERGCKSSSPGHRPARTCWPFMANVCINRTLTTLCTLGHRNFPVVHGKLRNGRSRSPGQWCSCNRE